MITYVESDPEGTKYIYDMVEEYRDGFISWVDKIYHCDRASLTFIIKNTLYISYLWCKDGMIDIILENDIELDYILKNFRRYPWNESNLNQIKLKKFLRENQ